MHETVLTYCIQGIWWLHRSATTVSFIASVVDLLSIIGYNLDLSNFLWEFGLSYFLVFTICLLLVCFVIDAGCQCFDFLKIWYHILYIIELFVWKNKIKLLTLSGPGGLRGPDCQTHSGQSETSYPMMPKLGDF